MRLLRSRCTFKLSAAVHVSQTTMQHVALASGICAHINKEWYCCDGIPQWYPATASRGLAKRLNKEHETLLGTDPTAPALGTWKHRSSQLHFSPVWLSSPVRCRRSAWETAAWHRKSDELSCTYLVLQF